MVSDGHAGLDAMLAGVQAKFPGFVLKRISKVDSHNNAVRFAWSLGPAAGPSVVEGVDFATVDRRQARLDRGLHRQDAGLTGLRSSGDTTDCVSAGFGRNPEK